MQTLEIRYASNAARRLDWQGPCLAGELCKVRFTDPRATGILATETPAHIYLALASTGAAPAVLAVAGPFAAIEETAGTPPATTIVAWEAELDLGADAMAAHVAGWAPGARGRVWAGMLDATSRSILATGEAVVEATALAGGGGVPTLPTGVVLRSDFDSLSLTRPASLTSLADMLAAIIAALKGS